MARQKERGCFKTGCLGCGCLVVVFILVMVLFTVIQLARDSSDRRNENRLLVRELPAPPDLDALRASGELASLELPLALDIFDNDQLASKVGKVVLDLSVGDFTIRAGDPGEPLRVDADYEADAFRLEEVFSESESGGWTYEITFKPKGGMVGMMFRGAGNNPRNDIEITLPRGQPLDLEGDLGLGETHMDLGGLWLRRVDLRAGTGEHIIEFGEPLAVPMSSFHVDKGMGELRILELGNASPRDVVVRMSIGELRLEMGGPWVTDSKVVVDFGIGEGRVILPAHARVEVERARILLGDAGVDRVDNQGIAEDAPTIRVDLHGKLGGIALRRQ